MKATKSIKTVAIYFAIFTLLNIQCSAAPNQHGQDRKLPSFNELILGISGEVHLKQGPVQKVEIVASDKILELIETEVKGTALHIKWNTWNVSCHENIKIYITMVDVKGVRVSGSGNVTADELITSDNIDLSISGSGNINMKDLKAESIKSSISGSADIMIDGANQVNTMNASISGSGSIKAQDLPVKNVEVSISGSGNCMVKATESLQARIAGSGDIYYKGSATIDGKVSGSGKIKHVD